MGSPHAWPQLLGAIEWLVEILNYDKLAAEKGGHTQQAFGGAVEDLTREGDQRFVKYLDASYKAFLAGNDEHYAALEKEFSASFTQTTAEVGDLVKSEEGEQARLMTEIETEKSTGASVPEKKKKLAVLNNDHAKLEDFVKQLKEHESALDQKVATKRKDLSNGSAELAECKEKIVSLKERIAKQKLSADEARRMVDEKGRLEKNVKEATEYHQAMNQKAWEGDMELNRGRENLERAVHQYGTLATQLQLLPFGAKNANGVDFRILVNGERIGTAACLEDVISTDVTATIVPALRQKKDLVAKKGQALRESVNALQDKEEQSRKALESVAESLEKHQVGGLSVRRWIAPRRSSWGCDHHFTRNKATLTHMINLVDSFFSFVCSFVRSFVRSFVHPTSQARHSKLEDQLRQQKEGLTAALTVRAEEQEALESEAELLQDNPAERERRRCESQKRIALVRSRQQEAVDRHHREAAEAAELVAAAIAQLTSFKDYSGRRLTDLRETMDAMQTEFAA